MHTHVLDGLWLAAGSQVALPHHTAYQVNFGNAHRTHFKHACTAISSIKNVIETLGGF